MPTEIQEQSVRKIASVRKSRILRHNPSTIETPSSQPSGEDLQTQEPSCKNALKPKRPPKPSPNFHHPNPRNMKHYKLVDRSKEMIGILPVIRTPKIVKSMNPNIKRNIGSVDSLRRLEINKKIKDLYNQNQYDSDTNNKENARLLIRNQINRKYEMLYGQNYYVNHIKQAGIAIMDHGKRFKQLYV